MHMAFESQTAKFLFDMSELKPIPVHSHRRNTVRPKHGEDQKFWVPKYQEWLSLTELAYRKIVENEQWQPELKSSTRKN
jgi:hypothetical protein